MTRAELTKQVMEAWTIAHPALVERWKPEGLRKQAEGMAELVMMEAEAINPDRPSRAILEAMGLLLRDPPPAPTRRQSRAL